MLVHERGRALRARCVECRRLYEPLPCRSRGEERLRKLGRYLCRGCECVLVDRLKRAMAMDLSCGVPIEDRSVNIPSVLLTHTDGGFMEQLRLYSLSLMPPPEPFTGRVVTVANSEQFWESFA